MKNNTDKIKKEEEEKKEANGKAEQEEFSSACGDACSCEEKECRCEVLEKKIADFENSYKRALADYQNLQKRVVEEKQSWIKLANSEVLLRLLPVLDTLFLANKHQATTELQVSIQQFLDALKAEGVTRIETKGKNFDPQFMEAITLADGEEGKVLEETRAGFLIHDKLLRPAQVIVGQKSENEKKE